MYQNIFGFFGFQKIYSEIVSHLEDGDCILEIGSFLGRSTFYLADKIEQSGKRVKFYTCDPWQWDMVSSKINIGSCCDVSRDCFETFKQNLLPFEQMIIPIRGKSRDVLPRLSHLKFKFIFIDGSHLYEDVAFDIKWAKQLITEDGVIAGDDYQCPDVKKAVDQLLPGCEIINGNGNIMYRYILKNY